MICHLSRKHRGFDPTSLKTFLRCFYLLIEVVFIKRKFWTNFFSVMWKSRCQYQNLRFDVFDFKVECWFLFRTVCQPSRFRERNLPCCGSLEHFPRFSFYWFIFTVFVFILFTGPSQDQPRAWEQPRPKQSRKENWSMIEDFWRFFFDFEVVCGEGWTQEGLRWRARPGSTPGTTLATNPPELRSPRPHRSLNSRCQRQPNRRYDQARHAHTKGTRSPEPTNPRYVSAVFQDAKVIPLAPIGLSYRIDDYTAPSCKSTHDLKSSYNWSELLNNTGFVAAPVQTYRHVSTHSQVITFQTWLLVVSTLSGFFLNIFWIFPKLWLPHRKFQKIPAW